MANHHDDARVADLLATLGDGGSKGSVPAAVAEGAAAADRTRKLTAAIGACRHERSDTRTNYRNGGRTRTLSTPGGM